MEIEGKDKSYWNKKWIEEINLKDVEIPLLSQIPKGEDTLKHSLTTLSKLTGLSDIIRTNSEGRFKTVTEVRRAADYIGIMILFKIFGEKENTIEYETYGKMLYTYLLETENFIKYKQTIGHVVVLVDEIVVLIGKGLIKEAEAREKINNLIVSMPYEIQDECRNEVKIRIPGFFSEPRT